MHDEQGSVWKGKEKRNIWTQNDVNQQSCYWVIGKAALQLVSTMWLYQVFTPDILSDWSGLLLVDACAVLIFNILKMTSGYMGYHTAWSIWQWFHKWKIYF